MSADSSLRSLPPRPNLRHLKLQAEELLNALRAGDAGAVERARNALKDAQPPFALHQAQFVVAREYGFDSWPKLKEHLELVGADFTKRVALLTSAACSGNVVLARKILAIEPTAAKADLYAACACGEGEAVAEVLAKNPSLARTAGGPTGWQPLLYLCFSRLYRDDAGLRDAAVSIARMLLDRGADPNAFFIDEANKDGPPQRPIYGACGVLNHPQLARLLLERGADPNDDESFYHSTEHRDHACMKLLMEFKTEPRRTNALKRMLDFEDEEGLRLMLDYGFDPNEYAPGALQHSILRGRSVGILEMLLTYGADLNAKTSDGKTPYAWAVMLGRDDVAEFLHSRGADTAMTESQKFIAACMRGDGAAVRGMLARDPRMLSKLSSADLQQLAEAAWRGDEKAVRVMLDAGFDVSVPTAMNMQPLHCAAFEGHAKIVEMLLKHHPQLETRNGYGGTPLTAAIHGAAHRVNASGDYAGVIRALIAAGVSVDGPEKDGRPLRFAAKAGYLDGVKLLAEAGARVDLCDEEGRNARGIAEEMGYQDIAEFLRSSPGRR